MIENPKTPRIRRAAALARKKDRLATQKFVAEGVQAVYEALRFAPGDIEVIYATHAGRERATELDRLANDACVQLEMVSEQVFAVLTDTVTPQGVAAIMQMRNTQLQEALQNAKLVAVLHEVRDPGNAGAVLRAADAAGADAVIFSGDCIDPWHPKVVRSTTGSLFHLPVSYGCDLSEVIKAAQQAGLGTIAADVRGSDISPTEALLQNPTAWIFGNEAHGLSASDRDKCDAVRRLPLFGAAESLNLATAATVCLYVSAFAHAEGSKN
ncbi:MAG: RNA methyltransferase [Microbacteriaceae bacterium]|nr:RNA methyltransferase [Microbacteriaceae bacterium]